MNIVTRGLGAGSYPEPPPPKEKPVPRCRCCGSEEGDFTQTGLCPPCAWKTLALPFYGLAQGYVEGNQERRKDFYLSFLFRGLSGEEQIEAVKNYYMQKGVLPYEEYLRETQEEFLAYLQGR